MARHLKRYVVVAALAATSLGISGPAMAQRNRRLADEYGLGPEGTIGRGTNILPGGPSARDDGPSMTTRRTAGPTTYYRTGYSGDTASPATRRGAPAPAALPYLTNQFFAPGDGYRYPLYFNPAARVYFYYPVRH